MVKHNTMSGTNLHQPFRRGLDADKPASPTAGDWYFATDTYILYRCFVDGTWKDSITKYLLVPIQIFKANYGDNNGEINNFSIETNGANIYEAIAPIIISTPKIIVTGLKLLYKFGQSGDTMTTYIAKSTGGLLSASRSAISGTTISPAYQDTNWKESNLSSLNIELDNTLYKYGIYLVMARDAGGSTNVAFGGLLITYTEKLYIP